MQLNAASLPPIPGPPPADLLAALAAAHPDAEWALLHAADGQSASVLAGNPLVTLEVDPHGAAHLATHSGFALPPPLHPLTALQTALDTFRWTPPHPLIGWLGFLSYHLAHTLEAIGAPRPDPSPEWPLLRFTLYRHYLLHDPLTGQYTPIALDDRPDLAAALLNVAAAPRFVDTPARLLEAPPEGSYAAMVRRAQAYIAAGDIYQANLAQRWSYFAAAPPHEIYRRLCARSPAPYAACLQFRDHAGVPRHLLSASPELFLRLQEGRAITRPIKGTRPRDLDDAARDQALADELLASPKDHAELAMIVDLLRNDLGRIARYGSVDVAAARTLERHPTVWHTVATIAARLRERATLADLLRATLPGGSITGAPKIRACQIINDLEPHPRNIYCGHIGVIGPAGKTATLNIAIRTLQFTGQTLHLHAGAGITADSDPDAEHDETLAKARALLESLTGPFG